MGYIISQASIDRMQDTLDIIYANAIQNKLTVLKTVWPKETRWFLSQAIASAKALNVEPYCRLEVRIKLRPTPSGEKVLVVHPRVLPENIEIEAYTQGEAANAKVIHGASSLLSIATATMKETDNILAFPDLEPSLLENAKTWAERLGHTILSLEPFTIKKTQ